MSLPYRLENPSTYDNYDETYAQMLSTSYAYIESDIKDAFNNFTHNLMLDTHIRRNLLLDAIDDFEKRIGIDLSKNRMWQLFHNNAFNYRPYQ